MHEVRLAEQRQVGPVVDDERHSEPARHVARLMETRQKLGIREPLLADLHDVDAAPHGRLEKAGEVISYAA